MLLRIITMFVMCCSIAEAMEQVEIDKVNKLIDKVGSMTSYKFIRNGSDHTVAEAAKLMRYKLDKQHKDLKTVEEFIDTCLTASSSSGKPYQIRDDKGHVTACAEVLKRWAQELVANATPKHTDNGTAAK